MVGKPLTVFERAQRTGYVTGPQHRLVDTLAPPAEAQNSPAPNYRVAVQPDESCSECVHFALDPKFCNRFNFNARPQYVCDDFEAPNQPKINGENDSIDMDVTTMPRTSARVL